MSSLKGTDLFPLKAILSELFCLFSEKSSAIKGKNLFPLRVKSFNSRPNVGQDLVYKKGNRVSQKLCPLLQMAESCHVYQYS